MNRFSHRWGASAWQQTAKLLAEVNTADVERALLKKRLDFADFAALISPLAEPFLEVMAQQAQALTRQRFGNTIVSYVPLYLSNVCANWCTYCGFSMQNKIKRKTLNPAEIDQEIAALKQRGFDHVLLLTGEAEKTVGIDYLSAACAQIKPHFSQVNIEVQPLQQHEYARLRTLGVEGLSLYQETYDPESYAQHHLKGNKQNMAYRLDAPERAAAADFLKINLGVLLGLSDWRRDSLACAMHLRYLQQKFWTLRFGLSFPRLRPCTGELETAAHMSDRQLVQLILAWRLFEPELDLNLSTRESAQFRQGMSRLGITSMSAESITQPGGYAETATSQLEQFSVEDRRSLSDIGQDLAEQGLQLIATDSYLWPTPSN